MPVGSSSIRGCLKVAVHPGKSASALSGTDLDEISFWYAYLPKRPHPDIFAIGSEDEGIDPLIHGMFGGTDAWRGDASLPLQ